jgi:hypothetical protein
MANNKRRMVKPGESYRDSGASFARLTKKEYEELVAIEQKALDIEKEIQDTGKQRLKDLQEEGTIATLMAGKMKETRAYSSLLNEDGTMRKDLTLEELEAVKEGIAVQKERGALEKQMYDQMGDMLNPLQTLEQGFMKIVQFAKAFTQVLKFNPVLAIAAAMMALLALAKKVLEQVNEIREEFGLTAMNATKVAGSIRLANFQAKRFLLDSEQVKASYEALAKTFGQLNHQTVQFSVEVARVARNTGLGAENVAELLASITAATGESKDLALETLNTLTSFTRMEGVAPGVVLKDLAANADLFASFIGRGERNLIKAAAAARKVGMEFGSIVDFGDQLLNITDRLEKEQTLSIITGKQIRLDRVAILTSQGRIAEAQRELATQLRAVQGLSAQQVRFAAQQVGMDVNALLKLVKIGEAQLGEQQKANRMGMT